MDSADIEAAALAWLPAWELPAQDPVVKKDLKGEFVRVAKFTDESVVRFFFPRRKLLFQQRMVKFISRLLYKRGAQIESVPLTAEDFARWLEAEGKTDTPELRFAFATRPPVF